MTTGLPSAPASLSARMRATRSLGPPVVTGTTILTGLAGYEDCAPANGAARRKTAAEKKRIIRRPQTHLPVSTHTIPAIPPPITHPTPPPHTRTPTPPTLP